MARRIELEGCFNLRDVGGYRTVLGSVVRRGCVFRSDSLHALTDDDLVRLAELGIRVVFDLRNQAERDRWPSRLPSDIEVLVRTSPSTSGPLQTIEDQIAAGEVPVADDEEFAGVYIQLLDRLAPELRIIMERAARAVTEPLLFHCLAGKDRTGVAAAVLLGVLGVADDVILDDYELTSTYFTPSKLASLQPLLDEHGVVEERIRPLLSARRAVLAATLTQINERWGGIEGYVRDHLEIPATLIDHLRHELLVPAHRGRVVSSMIAGQLRWQAWCEESDCGWHGEIRGPGIGARRRAEIDAAAHFGRA